MVTKKTETFFLDQSQCRAKIQTMARMHTHADEVQNMAFLVNNVPFAKFPKEVNRAQSARLTKYSDETFFARQSRALATRSDLKICIILLLLVIIGEKAIFFKEKWGLLFCLLQTCF